MPYSTSVLGDLYVALNSSNAARLLLSHANSTDVDTSFFSWRQNSHSWASNIQYNGSTFTKDELGMGSWIVSQSVGTQTNDNKIEFGYIAPSGTTPSNVMEIFQNTVKLNANTTTVPLIIASGSSTQDLLRITQVGTGNAFVVEDSANPDTSGFVINASGNVGVGINATSTHKLYVYTTSNSAIIGISLGVGVEGVGSQGLKGSGTSEGVYGQAIADGLGEVIGVVGVAAENDSGSGTYIGGKFQGFSSASGTNYGIQILDDTEGIDKILTSVTADGKANWKSDIKVTSIIASASSTSDIVRITQTGSGNALVVEDSTNPDNSPFVVTGAGNVGVGTASPTEKLWVSGNAVITGTMSGSGGNRILTDALIQAGLLYLSNNC